MVAFIYGPHARDMLAERGIQSLWVERTVAAPDATGEVYERIGNRVRIITVFLDRSRRRRE